MSEKRLRMTKRCLMKSAFCVVFIYGLSFIVMSILFSNIRTTDDVIFPDSISFISNSYENSTLPYKDDWRQVFGSVYVYSAFWEYRTNPTMVRIIGIGLRLNNYTSKLICLLNYKENGTSVTTATSENFVDHHNARVSVKFFYCNATTKPIKVALVSVGSTSVSWLRVHDTNPNTNSSKNGIAVCMQPLHNGNSFTEFNVAEFVAYYEMMGVNRFVFYDHTAGVNVRKFLNRLSLEGAPIFEIMPWTFPNEERWNVWSTGQDASVADCVYKLASNYEYVAIVDFDEYIMPSSDISLLKILKQLDENNGSNWCSYMFQHTVFCKDRPDDPLAKNVSLPFVTQLKTTHGKIWDPYYRAKSVVRPRSIVLPGIHYTWEALPNWNVSFPVSPSTALLHHYRGILCQNDEKLFIDRTAWRYHKGLLESKAIKLWQSLNP